MIAEQLSMEKEVVRVWFCNRRQKEKRINCPVTTPIKSPIYNSRLVSCRGPSCHQALGGGTGTVPGGHHPGEDGSQEFQAACHK